ncbi:MAG: YqiA/YcfP family alpha/beta fold hydrolase [Psychroflexus sp.]
MNILYLHGLKGNLTQEKREILEAYGHVHAPTISYEDDKNVITNLKNEFSQHSIDFVIGSSLGGFAGFHLANIFQKSALLFNPALASQSVQQEVPEYVSNKRNLKHVVLGAKDEIVNPSETLSFLSNHLKTNTAFTINYRLDLAHRIPVEIFQEEVELFFKHLYS